VIVAQCGSARLAAAALREHRPDLLFLDVRLPVVDGFASIEGIPAEEQPVIVVTTAFPDYALTAYQRGAISYLIKPLTEASVDQAVDRARVLVRARRADDAPEYAARLAVKVDDGMMLLRTSDIDWIEGADDYARIVVGDRSQLVRDTLRDLERALDPRQFIRVHRSAIVNIDRVRAIRPQYNGRYVLVLTNGARIMTSKTRRSALAAALGRGL
jgi:two-component system LytT family response regulator